MNEQAIARLERECEQVQADCGALHDDYVLALKRLALAQQTAGRMADAARTADRIAFVLAHLRGPDHPDHLEVRASRAAMLQCMGHLEDAEAIFAHDAEQWTTLGDDLAAAATWARLAWLHTVMGRHDLAVRDMAAAEQRRDAFVAEALEVGDEAVQRASLERVEAAYQVFVAIALRYFPDHAEAAEILYRIVLRRKLLGLDACLIRRIGSTLPNGYRLLHRRLTDARLGRVPAEASDRAIELGLLGASLSADHPFRFPGRGVDLTELAARLPEHGALIEFVCMRDFDRADAAAEFPKPNGRRCYVVFVLGADGSLCLRNLGDADAIDGLADALRVSVVTGRSGQTRGLLDCEVGDAVGEDFGHRLQGLLLEPLADILCDRTALIFALDGVLTRIPMEILPLPDGTGRLLDRYLISYVDCATELLMKPGRDPRDHPSRPVVVADPRFGPGLLRQWLGRWRRSRAHRVADADLPPLPGSRLEGRCVAAKLGARLLTGRRASVAAVRRLRSPRILHIATHGRGLTIKPNGAGLREDGMLRHGLALRGSTANGVDGMLTAADIASLDLAGTELVVLSACESGLGETVQGDGVIGLRRGFALAGVRALVMSLWPVDDQATTLLMMRFYEELIDHGQSPEQGLRSAQRWLRGLTSAEAVAVWHRLDPKGMTAFQRTGAADGAPYAHPRFWGAFVLNRYGAVSTGWSKITTGTRH